MQGKKIKVVHYINQFFGQIGGEDKADTGFIVKEGPVGPGMALKSALGEDAEIVATVICGDNYFSKDPEKSGAEAVDLIKPYAPDLFFAGPGFEAGRYGVSCGAVCKAVGDAFDIPCITGLYSENPGVEMYRRNAYIVQTGNSTRGMVESVKKMVALGKVLVSGEEGKRLVSRENIPRPEEFGYFSRNVIRNEYTDMTAAERAVDKVLAKLKGEPFESEVIMPVFERITPPAAISDISKAHLAVVSDGGLIPKGNPDGMSGRGNKRWAKYTFDTFVPDAYDSDSYEVAHTGYFPVDVVANPNRLVGIDVLRELIAEKKIGKLNPSFYSTSGNATVAQGCQIMGEQMALELKNEGVQAVILTST